jgi:hypothetical protein
MSPVLDIAALKSRTPHVVAVNDLHDSLLRRANALLILFIFVHQQLSVLDCRSQSIDTYLAVVVIQSIDFAKKL